MKVFTKFSIFGVIAGVLLSISLFIPLKKWLSAPGGPKGADGKDLSSIDGDAMARPKRVRDPSRQMRLNEFKDGWNRISLSKSKGSSDEATSKEEAALVKAAVSDLLCSEELVEFVRYLESKKSRNAEALVEAELSELLRSGRGPDIRKSLLAFVSIAEASEATIYLPWVQLVGRNCSKDEIVEFHAALKVEGLKFEALGSYNSANAKADPVQSITSTLAEYRLRGASSGIQPIISQQIALLPDDANFEQIEKMIPEEDGSTGNPIIRRQLLKKWARQDPAAAANYVMANPGRISAKYIQTISDSMLSKGPDVAMDWAQGFPEGPYYDNAVAGVVLSLVLIYPDQSLVLAERIEDPVLRERYVTEVKKRVAAMLEPKRGH